MENIDCRDISISDHEERDMHNDQDIVSSDNSEEFLENNSDDDTVSKHHKKVVTYNYIAFHCKYAHCKSLCHVVLYVRQNARKKFLRAAKKISIRLRRRNLKLEIL